jgi:hypothetical protein
VDDPNGTATTVVRTPLADRVVVAVVIPGALVLLGLVLPVVARWLLALQRGLPFKPVIWLVGSIDTWWEIALHVCLWLAIGVGLAVTEARKATVVTLTDTLLRLDRAGAPLTLDRADVGAVFSDGRLLVVLGPDSRPVFRDTHEVPTAALAAAFRRHGYPWHDADPFAGEFRPWHAGDPSLPPAVDAVLAARLGALTRNAHQEVHDLGRAADRLGYVVRETGATQYWRAVRPP